MKTTSIVQSVTYQRGSALAIGLLILFIMTIVGVTGMQTTSMQEKMAGNMRDRNLAFQAAESALRAGENYLNITSVLPSFSNSNGLYQKESLVPNSWYKNDDAWWVDSTKVRGFSTTNFSSIVAGTAYILEELAEVIEKTESLEAGKPVNPNYFRVTARGVGGTTNAVVIVQSVYKR